MYSQSRTVTCSIRREDKGRLGSRSCFRGAKRIRYKGGEERGGGRGDVDANKKGLREMKRSQESKELQSV